MPQAVGNLAVLRDGSFLREIHPETWTDIRTIAAATPEAFAVPSGATKVFFGATGGGIIVRANASLGGTAAAATDTADGTGCEVNPAGFYFALGSIAEFSVRVTADNTVVSATFYR